MCIRDSHKLRDRARGAEHVVVLVGEGHIAHEAVQLGEHPACPLYTSDAAAERSSVDLGGRRIIKKKTKKTKKKRKQINTEKRHGEMRGADVKKE